MVFSPPKLADLKAGTTLIAGVGVSTVLADIDFETYSPAGFVFNEQTNRFESPPGANKKGLFAVGVAVYTEHPEAEVLSCAYNLKDGQGNRHWSPYLTPEAFFGALNPLFEYVKNGGLLEAWNSSFEYWVWTNICVKKYGWPPLPQSQFRCAMAKSRAFALPGSLENSGTVLNTINRKDKTGKRLLDKFSIPRNPTKLDSRKRILLPEEPTDASLLFNYNVKDIEAEAEISSLIPDLNEFELKFWLCDQAINHRGVQMDKCAILDCISILEKAHKKYNDELRTLTNGTVTSASEVMKIRKWMFDCHQIHTEDLNSETVENLLLNPMFHPSVKRVLEIRQLLGSAAVKKLYSMLNFLTEDNRVHDLFMYHSARTGRAAGTAVQPQNLPNSGLPVLKCECNKYYITKLEYCPWCGKDSGFSSGKEWSPEAVENALIIISNNNLELVEHFFGDATAAISGCLRGLFISKPKHDLICSDYSAIEAVVLAALSGEEWRLEVFKTHGMIYEMSASKITGIPFEEFIKHKKNIGQHHPMRKKVGKVAELASGYQGWIGAWKQFGADEFFSDDEIKQSILAWRKASPKIVEMWGGQQRNWLPEYYGLEGAAIQAVMFPGTWFNYREILYLCQQNILYCKLPSGRYITYHKPQISPSTRRENTFTLSFEGWNTNPKNGAMGWIRMHTYGGKLTENVVQAVARDILANAIINLEENNYPVVLHVHDEIVCEIPENWGSIQEFEKIMSSMPTWASDWPIKANGGWRSKRYAK